MKRICILFLLIVNFTISSSAQIFVDRHGNVTDQRKTSQQNRSNTENKTSARRSSFDPSRLEFGGNLGLQFGSYTVVNVSPQVGYRFSDYFSAGAGLGYTFFKDDRGNYDYREHFLGFNLYANVYPIDYMIVSVRPEISRMWMKAEEFNGQKYRDEKFVPSVVVGVGFRVGGMTAQIKYDVVQDKYSPYGNRLFYSIGYTF